MKIPPSGAELFHTDRRIDMKAIVAFRNFANAPNNGKAAKRFHISYVSARDLSFLCWHQLVDYKWQQTASIKSSCRHILCRCLDEIAEKSYRTSMLLKI